MLHRLSSPLPLDAYLTLANPLWGTRLRGVIERIEPVGESAATITIRPARSWSGHAPGQFVTVSVDVNGVRHQRCYSITSLPVVGRQSRIEITVQAVAAGVVSDHLVHHARPGEVVQLGQAEGEFVLPAILPERLLFITGGSGITPVMSMLRSLDRRSHRAQVVVLHHAATLERALFADELAVMAARSPWLRVETTHTRVDGAHLDAKRLDESCAEWRDAHTYVCGPTSLIEFAAAHFATAGVADHLHVERFSAVLPAAPSIDHEGDGGQATFSSSNVAVATDGTMSLLEVAEAAGLAPAHGCRMGICHTCSTPLDAGCVRDLRDGRLIESGGHIQLCVSAAATDVVIRL